MGPYIPFRIVEGVVPYYQLNGELSEEQLVLIQLRINRHHCIRASVEMEIVKYFVLEPSERGFPNDDHFVSHQGVSKCFHRHSLILIKGIIYRKSFLKSN